MAQMTETVDYVQFLGHELRSPLSAVKTALEVLQDELVALAESAGEPGEAPADAEAAPAIDPSLKMVELALRNVQRLRRTVDWSQDLLSLSHQQPGAELSLVPLTSVLDDSLAGLGQIVGDFDPDLTIRTDPDLLGWLLAQIRRVLDYDDGYRLVAVQVERIGERLHLSFCGERRAVAAAGSRRSVNKTTLVLPNGTRPDEDSDALQHLAAFMISPHLLQELHADLQVLPTAPDRASICLRLPLAVC